MILRRKRAAYNITSSSFFEDTLLHNLISNRSAITDQEVTLIFNLTRTAWKNHYVNPEEELRRHRATPPAPAAGAAGGPAAPAPVGARFNRIGLSAELTTA